MKDLLCLCSRKGNSFGSVKENAETNWNKDSGFKPIIHVKQSKSSNLFKMGIISGV